MQSVALAALSNRNTDSETKDFSYNSGERQTATSFGAIRRDHASRYLLATHIVKEHFGQTPVPLQGLDLFCGNGYGTWLAATELKARVLGIDGSDEAIAVANQHFQAEGTAFLAKCFPFALQADTYDFILCFESIEHVAEPEALFAALTRALKPGGVLFVSTPNEATMPLASNAQWFRHHVRHFREEELIALARQQKDIEAVGQFGQKVYCLDRGRVVGIDETFDMLPMTDCPEAHFFIQLFMRRHSVSGKAVVA